MEAEVGEKRILQSRSLDRLQELLRKDRIRVDIDPGDHGADAVNEALGLIVIGVRQLISGQDAVS